MRRRTSLAVCLTAAVAVLAALFPPLGATALDDAPLACPDGEVPAHRFTDLDGNVHADAVACAAWYGVVEGTTETTYQPWAPVTRDQAASLVVRALRGAIDLPEAEAPFGDLDGNVHAEAIGALFSLGVAEGVTADAYRPDLRLSRGQLASLLVRAAGVVEGAPLPPVDGPTPPGVHGPALAIAVERGWLEGTEDGSLQPRAALRRDQAASVFARWLDDLVERDAAPLRSAAGLVAFDVVDADGDGMLGEGDVLTLAFDKPVSVEPVDAEDRSAVAFTNFAVGLPPFLELGDGDGDPWISVMSGIVRPGGPDDPKLPEGKHLIGVAPEQDSPFELDLVIQNIVKTSGDRLVPSEIPFPELEKQSPKIENAKGILLQQATGAQRQKIEELKRQQEDVQRRLEEEKERREELKEQNEELLRKLEEMKKEQQRRWEVSQEQAKEKAQATLLDNLSAQAAKRFRQKQREEQGLVTTTTTAPTTTTRPPPPTTTTTTSTTTTAPPQTTTTTTITPPTTTTTTTTPPPPGEVEQLVFTQQPVQETFEHELGGSQLGVSFEVQFQDESGNPMAIDEDVSLTAEAREAEYDGESNDGFGGRGGPVVLSSDETTASFENLNICHPTGPNDGTVTYTIVVRAGEPHANLMAVSEEVDLRSGAC